MMQLIKNELIKLRAQKSYLVLSCLVLTIVILVSFVTSVLWTPLNMFMEYGKDMLIESAAYEWAIDTIYENPDSWQAGLLRKVFKDPKSEGDRAREEAQIALDNGYAGTYEYFMAQARFYDFRDANDMPAWIERVVQNDLFMLYCWQSVAQGLLDGKYTPDQMIMDYYIELVLYPSFTELPYTLEIMDYDYQTQTYTWRFVIYTEGETEEVSYEQVLSDIRDCMPLCEQAIANAEKAAIELEPDLYYDSLIAQLAAQETEYLQNIADLQDILNDPEQYVSDWEKEYYASQIRDYEMRIENCKLMTEAYTTLKEQGTHPESDAFKIVSGLYSEILSLVGQTENAIAGAEASMADTPLLSRIERNSAKIKLGVLEKSLVVIRYAYQNDVHLTDAEGASVAKQSYLNNLSTAAFLVSVVTVVLASMILSREFATGTIRLWVIRPKTRSKLLWSKIATLLIYIVSMMLICFGIVYVFALINHGLDLFFYGESTMFAPNFGVVFGHVVRIPAVAEHLWALLVLILPIILYAMFCLLVSAVTKKGVLSIVLGMMLLMFASDIQAVTLAIANYTGAFGYLLQATVLPYLSMENLLGSALDYAISATNSGLGIMDLLNLQSMLMGELYGAMPYVCSSLVGVIVLGVHILFLMLCSLLWFKRMQIKS